MVTLIFTGTWSTDFSNVLLSFSKKAFAPSCVGRFADGEIRVELKDNIHGANVIIIQSTCPPVNENLMELLFMVSAANRNGAAYITAIVPYYGYARQDRRCANGMNISSADVATMLQTMGLRRLVTFDPHTLHLQGFFGPRVRVDYLEAQQLAVDFFENMDDLVIVSPDSGGIRRCRNFRSLMEARKNGQVINEAYVLKERVGINKVECSGMVGDVKGKNAIIIDDILDTGGTIVQAAEAVKSNGAKAVYIFITHGLFSGEALNRITNSSIELVVTTDTINHSDNVKAHPKIKIVTVAKLVADALNELE
ncbi:bifunctional Ribose-phosphate pyrophosphokinase/Phosphoribosyltransferase domain/Phosphoribosyltransferase-like/Ribose-phosphate pyrophosphokinase [Babesia duncani]|uniref:ribose-phosphate diphosphokinase n=1 Tax=Babesia duncani TaxID=323732 RepID=A0AAD9PL64_9APIC|nr:bifunctional Ribose-phosphate pyrophosphokinase/Phosphoribosyltransferase domain/Phosphoribosyltransferase-like/Ribose-phosphate pyrophosphokinase [Babesia duncani]